MANELNIASTTLQTWYAIVTQGGSFANGTSLEAFSAGHWTNYAVTLADNNTIGRYLGSMPLVTAGLYQVNYYRQAGGSPATSDAPAIVTEEFQWTGTVKTVPGTTVIDNATTVRHTIVDSGTVNYAALVGQNGTGGSFTAGTVTLVQSGSINYAATVGQNGTGGSFTAGTVTIVQGGTINFVQTTGSLQGTVIIGATQTNNVHFTSLVVDAGTLTLGTVSLTSMTIANTLTLAGFWINGNNMMSTIGNFNSNVQQFANQSVANAGGINLAGADYLLRGGFNLNPTQPALTVASLILTNGGTLGLVSGTMTNVNIVGTVGLVTGINFGGEAWATPGAGTITIGGSQLTTAGGSTAAQNALAVWNFLTASATVSSSMGLLLATSTFTFNGAYTNSFLVLDANSSLPIQGAQVSIGLNSSRELHLTGVAGNFTTALDAHTYTIAATVPVGGYVGQTSSLVITGNSMTTLTLTPATIPAPASPSTITGYLYSKINGVLTPGLVMHYQLAAPAAIVGYGYSPAVKDLVSDINSIWSMTDLEPGATYQFWITSTRKVTYQISSNATTPLNLPFELV